MKTIKIMFVCHGNICRSPMAEFIMKDMVEKEGLLDQIHIASCATSTEEIGNPVYPPARRELAKHGISCEGKRARQLKKSDYEAYDLFIGMDDWNVQNMKKILKKDQKIRKLLENKDVADPWYTGNFEKTYEDIEKGCQILLINTKSLLKKY